MSDFLKERMIEIFKRKDPPPSSEYLNVLDKVNNVLNSESREIRPYSKNGYPGGLIRLKKDIPTIIVPDLHARIDFFMNIMFSNGINSSNVVDKMRDGKIQVVCVGDGFHAEIRAANRWKMAFEEYKSSYKRHRNMDEEMRESLGVMEMVMEVKSAFPDYFHFLKGNHENIANERGGGNFPFRKFAYEGPMVLEYINKFYGNEFLSRYYTFEKNLPLFVVGRNFLISHAEPVSFFNEEEIIEYRDNPDLIAGLTWTDNNASEDGSVRRMLEYYLKDIDIDKTYYFGGHRPVAQLYNTRAGGRYVQIHNPGLFIIALIRTDRDINLNTDIIALKDKSGEILKN